MNFRTISSCCIFYASLLIAPAYAGTPIVVEYFGPNQCDVDLNQQKRLYEIVRQHEDIIFVNCRVGGNKTEQEAEEKDTLEDAGVPLYFNDFCTNRTFEFGQSLKQPVFGSLPVIVNGRWLASKYDAMAAVKLGVTDKLKKLDVKREGEILHVTVPEGFSLSNEGQGELVLFVYAPSSGIKIGKALDVPIKEGRNTSIQKLFDDMEGKGPVEKKQENNMNQENNTQSAEAFEEDLIAKEIKEKELNETFFRPVAAMEKIGVWDGSTTQYDFSLSTIAANTRLDLNKMGYVVLLQQGQSGAAPIYGAGEIIPSGEQMPKYLPSSTASNEVAE